MNEIPVFFCVDDYGMTPLTCERIEQCLRHGAANKISVFPNTEIPDIAARLSALPGTSFSVHISLVEGRCISDKKDLPLLTDGDGYFRHSFFGLLTASVLHPKAFSEQVYREIKAQILHGLSAFPDGSPVMLDSHQHTHMIPGVFRCLMQVISDLSLNVSYLRIPAEPAVPYRQCPGLYRQYLSINAVKHWVLKFCHLFNRGLLKKSGIPTALFCGIMFSGDMNYERMTALLPRYYQLARKKHCGIEVLFHSGYTNPGEPLFDPRKKEFHSFYLSEGRRREYDALMKLSQ